MLMIIDKTRVYESQVDVMNHYLKQMQKVL